MIKYFDNVSDIKKILSYNGAKIIVLLIARYSDGENLYSNIDEESLNDLCGENVILGLPAVAKNSNKTILEEHNCSSTLITDIIHELNIMENKVPCIYLYDTRNGLKRTVPINNNSNIYDLMKKIVIGCDKYLIEGKKQKNYAKGIDIIADSLMERKNPIYNFFSNLDNIIKTIAIVTSIYTIASIILNLKYKYEFQKFYSIPIKYFNTNYSDKIILLVCCIFLIATPIMCLCIKRHLIKAGSTKSEVIILTTLFSTGISLCIGILNILDLIFIIEMLEDSYHVPIFIANFINRYANGIVWGAMIVGILSVVGIVLFDNIGKIKLKPVRIIIQSFFWLHIMSTIILFTVGIVFKMTSSVENSKRYEVISYPNCQYIVLSNCDDKALVVPFDEDENGQYIFYTNDYKFVNKYEGSFKYITMKYKPLINRGIQ